jgi:hypothetical protein
MDKTLNGMESEAHQCRYMTNEATFIIRNGIITNYGHYPPARLVSNLRETQSESDGFTNLKTEIILFLEQEV